MNEHLPEAEWLQADREEELRRILAEQSEREGPPSEFDGRGCAAVTALMACAWIAAAGAVWMLI